MKKTPRVLAALLAVGFAVGFGAAPVTSAVASPQISQHAADTGWG